MQENIIFHLPDFLEAGYDNIKQNKNYSKEFKENAVRLYLTSEMTYEEVSKQLGIHTLNLLASWVNYFRKYGELTETSAQGRPKKTKVVNSMSSSLEDKEKIKILEKQLRYANIEVDYLKELRRLSRTIQMSKKQR